MRILKSFCVSERAVTRMLTILMCGLAVLQAGRAKASDAGSSQLVVYVPEIRAFSPEDTKTLGILGGAIGYFANAQFNSRMNEQTRDLSNLLGGANVHGDILRAIACPLSRDWSDCPNVVIVPEASLQAYLKDRQSGEALVIRIGAAGIFKRTYQVSVIATLVPVASDTTSGRRLNVMYRDWDASPESVQRDYHASLREIAAMLEAGLPIASQAPGGGLPAEWEAMPRLKEVRQSEHECVKNAVGDRVLKINEARAWLGSVNKYGLAMSSAKWVACSEMDLP
jgi:hypothetical protein